MSDTGNWQPPYGPTGPPGPGGPPPPDGVPPGAQGPPPWPGPSPWPDGQQWTTPGPGWTPPPKPGLIPLRPLGFGTLLGAPFQELRQNPKGTIGSGLIVQAVTVVLTVVVMVPVTVWAFSRIDQAAAEDAAEITAGSVLALALTALVPVLVSLIGSAFVQGVVVTDVARGTVGEVPRLSALWKATWPRLGSLLLWLLLYAGVAVAVLAVLGGVFAALLTLGTVGAVVGTAVLIIGLVGFAVVAAWVMTKLAVVPSIIVMERASVRRAMARSWSLTGGYFWRTFGILILVAVIVNVAAQVVTTPVSLMAGIVPVVLDPTGSDPTASLVVLIVGEVVLLMLSVVIAAITTVVRSAAAALIYIDLRIRKEGLDLELIRFVEARQAGDASVPDPLDPQRLIPDPQNRGRQSADPQNPDRAR